MIDLQAARQQLERLPRRQGHGSSTAAASLANNNIVGSGVPSQVAGASSNLLNIQVVDTNSSQNQSTRNSSSQFLIKYVRYIVGISYVLRDLTLKYCLIFHILIYL